MILCRVKCKKRKTLLFFGIRLGPSIFRLPSVCAGNNARKIARGWDGQGIIMYNVYDF